VIAMPTLEMIRLRSAMPNSGLLTLRYPLPPLNPVNIPDLPVQQIADESADEDANAADVDASEADLTEVAEGDGTAADATELPDAAVRTGDDAR